MSKLICLDYDGSYTEFPELFDMIIDKAVERGHRVILATMRYETEEDDGLISIKEKIPVYYTGRKAKQIYLHSIGIEPDLWIDDNPRWLYIDG